MITLAATTDNLQIKLDGAVDVSQMQCFATWRDITTLAFTPGRLGSVSNNTTDVNIVVAPAASTQRLVDYLSIYNPDTSQHELTVKLDLNGTETIIFKSLLQTGERVEFTEKEGFRLYTINGQLKSVVAVSDNYAYLSRAINTVFLSGDIANADATGNIMANVGNLNFPVLAGVLYWFRFTVQYTAALSTTGSRWAVSGPGAPTILNYMSIYTLTATTQTQNFLTAYDMPAASNASSLVAGNMAIVEGFVKPSVDGTIALRFASEILSSAITALAGSRLEYQRVI